MYMVLQHGPICEHVNKFHIFTILLEDSSFSILYVSSSPGKLD